MHKMNESILIYASNKKKEKFDKPIKIKGLAPLESNEAFEKVFRTKLFVGFKDNPKVENKYGSVKWYSAWANLYW